MVRPPNCIPLHLQGSWEPNRARAPVQRGRLTLARLCHDLNLSGGETHPAAHFSASNVRSHVAKIDAYHIRSRDIYDTHTYTYQSTSGSAMTYIH